MVSKEDKTSGNYAYTKQKCPEGTTREVTSLTAPLIDS
jgi:hypothetical protein